MYFDDAHGLGKHGFIFYENISFKWLLLNDSDLGFQGEFQKIKHIKVKSDNMCLAIPINGKGTIFLNSQYSEPFRNSLDMSKVEYWAII